MLKKIAFVMLLVMVLANVTVYAADATEVTTPAKTKPSLASQMDGDKAATKFSRGLTNIVTSPGEYIYQIPASQKQSPDYLTAFFVDMVRGTGYMVARLGTGLLDVVTAPFPGKTHYKPVMEPETIFTPVADVLTE